MSPEELAALHALCFDFGPRPWSAAEFSGLLDQTGVHLHLVEGGFALSRHAGPEAELLTLAVHPGVRRLGRANTLMQMQEAAAINGGCAEIFLEVAESNTAARILYGKQGFQEVGRRKNYYRGTGSSRVSALVLRKLLD